MSYSLDLKVALTRLNIDWWAVAHHLMKQNRAIIWQSHIRCKEYCMYARTSRSAYK